jgi:hypothetical protein
MSGNVVIDPAYWNNRMNYLAENGVVTYEQDWLGANAQPAFNLTDRGAFLGNMAAACSANKLDIQYCMPLPRDYLQSSLYGAVTNIRVSNDGFDRTEWDDFLYGSHLAASVGLWPWADVTTSAMTSCLVLQVLSAGPVGVGDEIGTENVGNLQRVAMADGTIVKPDTTIVPTDATYLSDAAGTGGAMVATTTSTHGSLTAAYVFAYSRSTTADASASIAPSSLGVTGTAYVFNYFANTGTTVAANATYDVEVGYDGSYFLVVPVGPSGIGFLGDAGKFVSLGSQRISSLSDSGTLIATVKFATGDGPITLHGYSPKAVTATATGGSITSSTYSTATQRFSIVLSPGSTGTASVTISA